MFSSLARGSIEDNGLVLVNEDAVLELPANGGGKDDFFEIATLGDEVLDIVAVAYAGNVLADDGAFVQIGSGKMSGGADDLDASAVGLVVGFGSREGRQEGVVNVDDGATDFAEKLFAEHLHVAGKDDQPCPFFTDECKLGGFGLRLGFLLDGDMVKWKTIGFGGFTKVGVVGGDSRDFTTQLAGFPTEDEVVEAMVCP